MTTASPAPRRPLLPSTVPSTPTAAASSKLTIPSVRLSLCLPPSADAKASDSSANSAASPSAPHPTSASSTCVLQSFMAKRSHGRFWQSRKEWKLRWVVLDRSTHQLRLYADSECLRHPELKPRAVYSTAGMECMPKGNENRADDAFGGQAVWSFDLILKEAGKKMELGCDTKEKRQEWMDFIAAARHDEADKENKALAVPQPGNQAGNREQQQIQPAASPTALPSPLPSTPSVPLLSPPRPPKRPLMGTPFAAPSLATPSTTATVAEVRVSAHEPSMEESKQQLSVPPPTPEPASHSSYLNKAIAAGTVVPLLPTRPQQPTGEAEAGSKKPALPVSAPRGALSARPPPAQPPPPPPQHSQPDSDPTVRSSWAEHDHSSADGADELREADLSDSGLASSLLAHHSALMEACGSVGSTAWNDEWQASLSKARNASSSVSSVLHSKHVYELQAQFVACCEKYARIIVEEYCLPSHMRTVKPVVEGVEREKQVFLMEGIGFQLAQAGTEDDEDFFHQQQQQQGAAQGQQGGSEVSCAPEMSVSAARLADQLGSKKATHELHTLAALHAASLPSSVCLPLMATVDYLGFRVKATATLPVYDESALVWGRDSQGRLKQTAPATAVLVELAASLNIEPHAVDGALVPLSSSIRVYRSGERYYVTELNNVAPVDVDVQYAMAHGRLQQGWPAKVFRHEYLLHAAQPLQSDVYQHTDTRLKDRQGGADGEEQEEDDEDDEDVDEEEAEARAADASRTLQHTLIPRFIKAQELMAGGQMADIPTVPQSILAAQPAPTSDAASTSASAVNVWPCVGGSWLDMLVDGADLCRAMHAHGINLRYLGRVAEASRQSHLRALSAVEMVARTVKALLNQNLRTVHRKVVSTEAARQQSADTSLAPHSLLLLQHSLLARHREGVVELMNLALGVGEDSDQFWTLLLYPDIRIKYALTADSPITLSYLRQLHLPALFGALQQRCGVCFVEREYAFGSERPIGESDFVAFTAHVKHAQPALSVDRHHSKARRACSSKPLHEVEAREWQRLCTAIDMQLTIRGWKQTEASGGSKVLVSEARSRLRVLNELINAQLQCGALDRAEQAIAQAAQLGSQLGYPANFSCLPASACASTEPPALTSFGSHAEHGRLQINRMWSAILRLKQAGGESSSAALADTRNSLTEYYQSGVSQLNYHVGLLHPLMLALHFALASFHVHSHCHSPPQQQAADGVVAVNLLTHCHQFARALFGSGKPLTWQLALTLAQLLAEQADYAHSGRWLGTAADGLKKAVEADKKSKGAEAEEERQRLRDRRAAVLADISLINDRQSREKEEKTQ